VQRYLTGYGGERGGFKTHITNVVNHELNITYFHAIPWFVRTYFHTLQVVIEPHGVLSLHCARIDPAKMKSSPSVIELCLTVPARSKVTVSVEFEKEFLHYTAFPPDAHRGFDLPASVVFVHLPASNNQSATTTTVMRLYTENLLLSLPTPDFSMLYNVITLTCTIMALFFGSIFNMSIRRLKHTFTGSDFVSDRPMARLYRNIFPKLQKISRRLGFNSTDEK